MHVHLLTIFAIKAAWAYMIGLHILRRGLHCYSLLQCTVQFIHVWWLKIRHFSNYRSFRRIRRNFFTELRAMCFICRHNRDPYETHFVIIDHSKRLGAACALHNRLLKLGAPYAGYATVRLIGRKLRYLDYLQLLIFVVFFYISYLISEHILPLIFMENRRRSTKKGTVILCLKWQHGNTQWKCECRC